MKAKYSCWLAILACIWMPATVPAQSIFKVVPTPNGNRGITQNGLYAAAASSPSDIWAVGFTTIHFDGTHWTAFDAPMFDGVGSSWLNGGAVNSPTDAWAIGIVGIYTANIGQAIEHWDGTQWSVYPGPTFPSGWEPEPWTMTAISPDNIWAVGTVLIDGASNQTLYERWDGTSWKANVGPTFGFPSGISADAANDIWVVGAAGLGYVSTPFSQHFDGTRWKEVATPHIGTGNNVLNGVVALAPDNVWAVGYSTASQTPPPGDYDVPTKTLIEHYDGTSWTIVPSPNVGPHSQYQSNRLLGITAVSPTDIWACGNYLAASGSGESPTLLLHWDGTSWSLAPSPSPDPGNLLGDILWSGIVTAPGSVWLVGSKDVGATAPGEPIIGTLVLHATGG